jgi:hypothetical protein
MEIEPPHLVVAWPLYCTAKIAHVEAGETLRRTLAIYGINKLGAYEFISKDVCIIC